MNEAEIKALNDAVDQHFEDAESVPPTEEVEDQRLRRYGVPPVQTCELCAGECRGHRMGHPKDWEPEPGSRAAKEAETAELVERLATETVLSRDEAAYLAPIMVRNGITFEQVVGKGDGQDLHRLVEALVAAASACAEHVESDDAVAIGDIIKCPLGKTTKLFPR